MFLFHNPDTRAIKRTVVVVGDLVKIRLVNVLKYHTVRVTALTDTSLSCLGGENQGAFTWPLSLISEISVISGKHKKALVAVVKSLDGHTSRGFLYRAGDSFIDLTRPEVKTLSETESDSLLRINIESVGFITFGAPARIITRGD